MAFLPARFYHAQPTTADADLGVAVSAGQSRIVKSIGITNTAQASSTVSISMVPSGASVGAANRIISNLVVQPGQTVIFDMSLVMTTGDKFVGFQTVALACTVSINGVNY